MHTRDLRAAIAATLTDDMIKRAEEHARHATPRGPSGMALEDDYTRRATFRRNLRTHLIEQLRDAITAPVN
jgi:hypothetical protein